MTDARAGLSVGVWLSLVLCMALWLTIDSVVFAAAHFVAINLAWIAACRFNRDFARRAVLIAGVLASIAGIFALLGVFLRSYN